MEKIERSLASWIPDGWFSNNATSAFWVTGYQIIHTGNLEDIRIYDFCGSRIIILHAELSYPRISGDFSLEVKDGAARVAGLNFDTFKAPFASYLLILQPYIVDGIEHSEYEVKKNAGTIAGFYTAINGFNMAYKRAFDFECSMDGQTTCAGPVFLNPGAFPDPDLSVDRLNKICDLGKKLDAMDLRDRNRIKLALYWFEQGLHAKGLDGFIKHWVAIETLAMPDETNVKPANEILAKLYGCTVKDASEKFGLGRIQGLRSRILHNGEDLSIHQDLSRYVEALFFDLLMACFGICDAHRSASILESPDFNLKNITYT
jgi:hypothetical protein